MPRSSGCKAIMVIACCSEVMDRSASGFGRFGYVPLALIIVEIFGAMLVAAMPPMSGCCVLNKVAPLVVVTEVPPRLNKAQQAASWANNPERACDSGIRTKI